MQPAIPFILIPLLNLLLAELLDLNTKPEEEPIDPLSYEEGCFSFYIDTDGTLKSRYACAEGVEAMSDN